MLPVFSRNTWMPEVFNDFFDTDFMGRANATAPAINVKESDGEYTVELAAPGLKKEDFNVNIDRDGNLHIHMESKAEHKDEDKKSHYLRREFSYSKYEQTLLLPGGQGQRRRAHRQPAEGREAAREDDEADRS